MCSNISVRFCVISPEQRFWKVVKMGKQKRLVAKMLEKVLEKYHLVVFDLYEILASATAASAYCTAKLLW